MSLNYSQSEIDLKTCFELSCSGIGQQTPLRNTVYILCIETDSLVKAVICRMDVKSNEGHMHSKNENRPKSQNTSPKSLIFSAN